VLGGSSLAHGKVAGHESAEVETDIRALFVSEHRYSNTSADRKDIAKRLRARRLEAGAMTSTKLKISFQLDDRGQPIDCDTYTRTDANSLVEEVSRSFNSTDSSSCYWRTLRLRDRSLLAYLSKPSYADTKVRLSEES
jgi:exoribonuclease R